MSNTNEQSSAFGLLAESSATGGGAKTSMPINEWLQALNTDGLIAIPTFHGVKGEQVGYRSGEIHNQLRQVLSRYFYIYRNVKGSAQPYMFVALKKKVFTDEGIQASVVSEHKEV